MVQHLTDRARTRLTLIAWSARARLGSIDERGGGRNTDESFHISGGAIIAASITAGVAAFVAKKLGALG